MIGEEKVKVVSLSEKIDKQVVLYETLLKTLKDSSYISYGDRLKIWNVVLFPNSLRNLAKAIYSSGKFKGKICLDNLPEPEELMTLKLNVTWLKDNLEMLGNLTDYEKNLIKCFDDKNFNWVDECGLGEKINQIYEDVFKKITFYVLEMNCFKGIKGENEDNCLVEIIEGCIKNNFTNFKKASEEIKEILEIEDDVFKQISTYFEKINEGY